ncbi:hypothetical protein [Bacteroides helcogenes]|uniref:hypothetical protein n=1 Tax=Bacteroides helcogenes TaxID=290053 RepID=UPI002A919056|nr:hypothetical protein [Bacteroides helcogenes]
MKMFTDNCSKLLPGGASVGQTRHPRDYAFSIPFIPISFLLFIFSSYSLSGPFLSSPVGFPDAKVDCRA